MTSFTLFLNNFHFIRPFWLLAIFALLPVIWLLKKHRFYQSPWQQFLPAHLSQVLVEGASNTSTNNNKSSLAGQAFLIKPFLIGLLSIIALAGPAWQKLPQPVYQTERGSVLIMDMSYSMYATDIKPNRLTRARFKAIDLLKKINEGDTGLIAYAGDAFVISPLTQDIKNIELLLPSLTPEIMPKPGANPLAALTLAHEMLLNAGHLNGDIYWFTDDVDNEELTDIYDWSNKFGHQLNILGVGSENGAPITLPSGELLKDATGAIVVPRLPSQKLKSLASRGHGNYQTITNNDRDINSLIMKDTLLDNNGEKMQQESQQTGDQWQEQGAWLLLLVLPLMLGYFRRGSAILMLPFSCLPLLFLLSFSAISPASFAADNAEKSTVQATNQESEVEGEPQTSALARTWQNLWQTKDQQAQQHYNQDNFKEAAQQFENAQWQGSAHYKAGNYQAALEAFKKGEQASSADSLYNQGNALAQLQQYEQAIESYENALKQNPDLQDAKDNIEKIKQLQKEQEQQQQQGDQSEDQQSQDQKDQQGEQQKEQQSQDQQSQDQKNEQNQQQSDDAQQQQKDQSGEPQDNEQQNDPQNKPKESSKEQEDKEAEQKQQEQQSAEEAEQADRDQQQGEEKTAAQIAEEQQAKETEQKHIQLLNKVTDDPYLLLRNKMQLEYQKRKQDGASQGVKKKW